MRFGRLFFHTMIWILSFFILFGSGHAKNISLSRSVEIAKQNNLEHRKFIVDYETGRVKSEQARLEFNPKMYVESEGPYVDSNRGESYSLEMYQPLYHFGALRHKLMAEKTREKIKLLEVISNELKLETRVYKSYMDILRNNKFLRLQRSATKRAKEQLEFVKTEVERNRRGPEATLRWEVLVNDYEESEIILSHQIVDSCIEYNDLLNLPSSTPVNIAPIGEENFDLDYMTFRSLVAFLSFDDFVDLGFEYAMRMSPDVKKRFVEIEAVEYDLKSTRADTLPKLDFTPKYNCDVNDYPQWSAKVTLSYFFLNQSDWKNIDIKKNQVRQSDLDKDIFLRDLRSSLRSQFSKLKTSVEQVVLKRKQSDQAYDYLNRMQRRYDEGKINDSEMVDAFSSFYVARFSEIDALYNYYNEKQHLDSTIGNSEFRQTPSLQEFADSDDKDQFFFSEAIDEGSELLRAVSRGDMSAVVTIIHNYPTEINRSGESDWTALHWAAYRGNNEILEYLISKGADINARTNFDMTPIYLAASENHKDEVKSLIRAGADVNIAAGRIKWTPLMKACERGYLDIAVMLIEAGADVNAESTTGWTALHKAAEEGETAIATLLLENGADIERKNMTGKTPMDYAIFHGNLDVIRILAKYKLK